MKIFYFSIECCRRTTRKSDRKNATKLYGSVADCVSINDGSRYPIDQLSFDLPPNCYMLNKERCHPTQKPVDLLEYLIKTYTNEGELVLDATMGSGSCGVAAVNTGRRFIGFELEKNFFEIAQRRIEEAIAKREQSLF